jgi:ABC-type glutathione transport system ATPase component
MLTSLEIENFKCFRQLKINPLAKVNLFVGTSNSGKTAVIEAVSMLPQSEGFKLPEFRDRSYNGDTSEDYIRWLFHDLRDEIPIVISGLGQRGPYTTEIASPGKGQNHTGNILILPHGKGVYWHPVSTQIKRIRSLSTDKRPATELAKDFDSWTRRTENEDRFVDFLKRVEPRLKRLRPFEIEGRRVLYADVGLPERIPLPFLGEGFNRLVQIYGAIIGEEADVLLIDEIENGLHWSALPQIWTGIREAVNKEEVQIFATTHSLECIAAAAEAFKGEPKNDLAVHRLERLENGDIRCVTMNEEELERMLERDWEVR